MLLSENFMSDSSSRKIAVVTGASSGIGAVYADRLAARGYDLVLVARRADRLAALASKLSVAHGRKVDVLGADLTNEADLMKVEQLLATNPDIRVLINNAGLARLANFTDAPYEDTQAQIALNIVALARLTHAVLPAFKKRNEGTIVNVASVLGIHAWSASSVYSGTKGFVVNFTRGLQAELAETEVRIQLLLPASTATEIWDNSGIPLSALNEDSVMTTENLVDAALAGLDQGEAVTWPSVADGGLWDTYDAARAALFAATQTGRPAPRYKLG
jgi:short-subunit dehydrogenase